MTRCARAAYGIYLERMDRPPAPMKADYAALHRAGQLWILRCGDQVAGFIVLYERSDDLFVETVAVDPAYQGRGLGARLMAFAEDQARRRGKSRIALYTNEAMRENMGFYAGLGYGVTDRRLEDGYRRVYFAKDLMSE